MHEIHITQYIIKKKENKMRDEAYLRLVFEHQQCHGGRWAVNEGGVGGSQMLIDDIHGGHNRRDDFRFEPLELKR